jgi:hypothetical protein
LQQASEDDLYYVEYLEKKGAGGSMISALLHHHIRRDAMAYSLGTTIRPSWAVRLA